MAGSRRAASERGRSSGGAVCPSAPSPLHCGVPDTAPPPRKPVPQPHKRRVVHGLLVGAALGGTLGAVNLAVSDVGEKLTETAEDPADWHATYARYTGWCVAGGGAIGLLGGAAAVLRDRYRGGRAAPPAGFAGVNGVMIGRRTCGFRRVPR